MTYLKFALVTLAVAIGLTLNVPEANATCTPNMKSMALCKASCNMCAITERPDCFTACANISPVPPQPTNKLVYVKCEKTGQPILKSLWTKKKCQKKAKKKAKKKKKKKAKTDKKDCGKHEVLEDGECICEPEYDRVGDDCEPECGDGKLRDSSGHCVDAEDCKDPCAKQAATAAYSYYEGIKDMLGDLKFWLILATIGIWLIFVLLAIWFTGIMDKILKKVVEGWPWKKDKKAAPQSQAAPAQADLAQAGAQVPSGGTQELFRPLGTPDARKPRGTPSLPAFGTKPGDGGPSGNGVT